MSEIPAIATLVARLDEIITALRRAIGVPEYVRWAVSVCEARAEIIAQQAEARVQRLNADIGACKKRYEARICVKSVGRHSPGAPGGRGSA